MKDSQRMIGAECEGCGLPSGGRLGTVSQRDLGSADKWHARCYRDAQAAERAAAARQRARARAAEGVDVSGELPGMRRNSKAGDRS